MTSSTRSTLALAFLFAAAVVGTVQASGMEPLDPNHPYQADKGGDLQVRFAKMWGEAELAVLGRVTEYAIVDRKAGLGVMIVAVSETFKGKAPGRTLKIRFHKPDCDNTACGGDGIPVNPIEFLFLLKKGQEDRWERILSQYEVANGAVEGDSVTVVSLKVPRAKLADFLKAPPEFIPKR